ncbi:MAG: serine hydrolase [Bacteroidota bacterium]
MNQPVPSLQTLDNIDLIRFLEQGALYFKLPELAYAKVSAWETPELYEKNSGVSGPSLFQIGSLSKLITALAILSLQEDEKLKIEDTVQNYLPWFGPALNPGLDGSTSIQDILLHEGGLPRGDLFQHSPSRSEIRDFLGSAELPPNVPGKKSLKYSNLGYILLGFIIESAGGVAYADYVAERIFKPLNMDHAGFKPRVAGPNISTPHGLTCFQGQNRSPFECAPMPWSDAPEASHGMYAGVQDMANLLTCLLQEGVFQGRQIWRPETIRALYHDQNLTKGRLGFGIGAQILKGNNGNIMLFMNGEHFGHSASFLLLPDKGFGLLLMSNRGSAGYELWHILQSIAQYYLEEKNASCLQFRFPYWKKLVGAYHSEHGDQCLNISASEGHLLLALGEESPKPLLYKSRGAFLQINGALSKYAIALDLEQGKIKGLQAGPHYFFSPSSPKNGHNVKIYDAITGIYANPKAGRVALFERNGQLILAYSPFKESVLKPISTQAFIQADGPFMHEIITIDANSGVLNAGNLTFIRTKEQY